MNLIKQNRAFLKDTARHYVDFTQTDQSKGVSPPLFQKPYSADKQLIDLPLREAWSTVKEIDLVSAIENRKSHRKFKPIPLKLDELSFLLWATQGIRYIAGLGRAYRVVPSAGCRHAFETYLSVQSVQSLESGIYRYLPIEHSLIFEHSVEGLQEKIVAGTSNQVFTGNAAVNFIWTVIPYRMEWRYDFAAHKVIAIDVGHVCQNLYLACEAIGCGTCAIAAYEQEQMDALLKVDSEDEYTIYLAPVGKI